mmetsp:Transcript_57617/g.122535  ORF Transcript_57617/g.122535 Transcript_57617/m.122535 type:complete len:85 (-) Transcript_57617:26-280(-)
MLRTARSFLSISSPCMRAPTYQAGSGNAQWQNRDGLQITGARSRSAPPTRAVNVGSAQEVARLLIAALHWNNKLYHSSGHADFQ